jgi:HEAT repeat protein
MEDDEREREPDWDEATEEFWDWNEEFPDLGDDPVASLLPRLSDDDLSVRWKAAWALGHLGDGRAVDPLIAALDFSRPFVVGEDEFTLNMVAAWALGRLQDPRAVGPLVTALTNECSDFVWIAAWSLGEIGDTRAVGPLREALKRGEFECIWLADEPVSEELHDHAEIAVLDYITDATFRDPLSPVVRALEKLGADTGRPEE